MPAPDVRQSAKYVVVPGPWAGYDGRPRATARPQRVMAIPPQSSAGASRVTPLSSEATVELLERVRQGDEDALDRLLQRCIPALQKWAHGRLPLSLRGIHETADLVHDTVIAAMKKLDAFDARHQGALQAYLRQAVMNRIRDIVRQRGRRPDQIELPEGPPDDRTSPLDQTIGAENMDRYEKALERLATDDREAIIGRLEFQYSYEELAVALDKPSAAAARMTVTRAMKRLAGEMLHG